METDAWVEVNESVVDCVEVARREVVPAVGSGWKRGEAVEVDSAGGCEGS